MAKRETVVAAPPRPKFFRHAKRPEWGVGRVTSDFVGLLRVTFEDGQTRDFRDDVLQPVADAEVPEAVRAAHEAVPVAAPVRARPSAKKRAAVVRK